MNSSSTARFGIAKLAACRLIMSFFNLTLMGYDDRFKALKHLESNSTEIRKIPTGNETKSPLEKQLAREMSGNLQSREWSTPAVSNQ